jgi:hypothetical protein
VPTSRNVNNLACPTGPKAHTARKRQFLRLSNPAAGPPEIETAAPGGSSRDGSEVGGKTFNNQSSYPTIAIASKPKPGLLHCANAHCAKIREKALLAPYAPTSALAQSALHYGSAKTPVAVVVDVLHLAIGPMDSVRGRATGPLGVALDLLAKVRAP